MQRVIYHSDCEGYCPSANSIFLPKPVAPKESKKQAIQVSQAAASITSSSSSHFKKPASPTTVHSGSSEPLVKEQDLTDLFDLAKKIEHTLESDSYLAKRELKSLNEQLFAKLAAMGHKASSAKIQKERDDSSEANAALCKERYFEL